MVKKKKKSLKPEFVTIQDKQIQVKYDAVAFHREYFDAEVCEILRSMTSVERKASHKKFGNLKFGLTGIAWSRNLTDGLPIDGPNNAYVIRAYRQAPEMQPDDFDWTELLVTDEVEEMHGKQITVQRGILFGGVLKDGSKRS